jgi:hypothetical protein
MVAAEPHTSRPIPEATGRSTLTLAAGKTDDGGATRASLQAVSDRQALGLSECARVVAGVVGSRTCGQRGRLADDIPLERPA